MPVDDAGPVQQPAPVQILAALTEQMLKEFSEVAG
jgi:hypothetical protein